MSRRTLISIKNKKSGKRVSLVTKKRVSVGNEKSRRKILGNSNKPHTTYVKNFTKHCLVKTPFPHYL